MDQGESESIGLLQAMRKSSNQEAEAAERNGRRSAPELEDPMNAAAALGANVAALDFVWTMIQPHHAMKNSISRQEFVFGQKYLPPETPGDLEPGNNAGFALAFPRKPLRNFHNCDSGYPR